MLGEHQELVQRFEGKDFEFIGINTDETELKELVSDFESNGVTWRNVILGSTDHEILDTWGVQAFPTLYVLDKEGVIRAVDLHGTELNAFIEEML